MSADAFTPGPPKTPEPPVDFASVLWQELDEIQKLRRNRGLEKHGVSEHHPPEAHTRTVPSAAPPVPSSDQVFNEAHKRNLIGLAFSGGGIRSATFNLGVLQGLASLGLLPIFDYLSTVSGGSYIGGWLESWIYRAGLDPDVAKCTESHGSDKDSPILRVQECLKPNRSDKIEHGESKAIRFLREYSNYLTPRLGFLGADMWTAAAIYIRNLLLNQSILILFLAFLLLLPYLAVYVTQIIVNLKCPLLHYAPPVSAFLLMLVAQCGVAWNVTHLTGDDRTGEFPPSARQGPILAYVAVPLLLFAWCLSVWIWHAKLWSHCRWHWCIGGVIVFSITWSLAALRDISTTTSKTPFWNSAKTRYISIGFSIISGVVGGLLLWVLADKLLQNWPPSDGAAIWHVVSFSTPLVVIIFLLVVTLQLGLMGILAPDPRREWWGRLGGWLLIMSIVWAAAFALSIYSPLAVMWSRKFVTGASVLWAISTLTGVLGGKSAKSGKADSVDSQSWKDTALSVTPYVFIIGLGIALATVLEIILAVLNNAASLSEFVKGNVVAQKAAGWIVSLDWHPISALTSHADGIVSATSVQASSNTPYVTAHWQILCGLLQHSMVLVYVFAAVAIACLFLAWRVDLNQFSMNLFYQNRLVRCYLGASHKKRKPNPFTGFDPEDDLKLSLLRSSNNYSGPFPIINTALNLVKGQNLAWQERKAESFVVTPLRCGFDTWLEKLDLDVEAPKMRGHKIQPYAFRSADNYAYRGGFRMGNAISISGAAASPSMGYHSVSSLAFLMTFFNVRLGAWSGNPRHDSTWMRSGPQFGLFQLLSELFGLTNDEARYVYLSDGGHFENLGLYELIKRRCRFIVVCDADCDDAYAFGDLGNAIRKCREDIGVEITLSTKNLTPVKASPKSDGARGIDSSAAASITAASSGDGFSKWHWAIGKIQYGLVDPNAADGILVYLKTSLTGDEPADVLNYHREHPDFPHQTTADQWFTESQFESYRRLGEHVVQKLFENTHIVERNIGDVFRELETRSATQGGVPEHQLW